MMIRTKIIKLAGYGRETKRPVIGYGQRPENGQRALNSRVDTRGVGQELLGPSYFFISLVLGPLIPLMVRTFLKVYIEIGSYFLFLKEQIKNIIIIICLVSTSTRQLQAYIGERGSIGLALLWSREKNLKFASSCASPDFHEVIVKQFFYDDDVFFLFLQKQKLGATLHIYL